METVTPPTFDCISIDIFNSDNRRPESFYSPEFLDAARCLLSDDGGPLIHNLHVRDRKSVV